MSQQPEYPVTQLLDAVAQGHPAAVEKLWSAVYDELRRMAESRMTRELPGRTLQPTALVNEAYLRLFGDGRMQWKNRRYFFAAAANAMRQILVDDARRRKRLKRGGGAKQSELLNWCPPAIEQDPGELLAINEAMETLAKEEPRMAEVGGLRYFMGLTIDETAEALGVSPRTVDLDWRIARAWLHRALSDDRKPNAQE